MTLVELQELRATILTQIVESGGVTSVSSDGMSVTVDRKDQLAIIDADIAKLTTIKPHFGLRFTQLVPPGAG